ncbi:bifunctional diaminohydroxyphosphoribosylaminopyrimidine deaminase/5-amino-6-(5-phosphoribosylamino)uracil reductase RibD [Knoellia sp. Soil729]|uniref:bifunctional diaminohydroxyphosphoribosylaminopyrimidine deaminase/5-amino-6-(5-phosphoribosylamino)uracil reductase RibD n=1 Tax=Knoellia sp. Soil729 TaxID=1736394 RepID=UPI0006F3D385|nr:bifunctional diaminohydroxyphosphoribosylaminopyrimidine deaminase/5-amino-6-(5-phosphoribosylamino)uracil reductase RibD [Knoellia sp. Soil729]KRE41278.1 bifunctional diaminohydroxyphosphoribosylaminopyrimidine deaminase/5-amino-6-(5-phosphoribosylamino)uracil reductase [Knoellia sp. Soil729]
MQHGTTDAQWMLRALAVAANGPQADPNPRVGCVIVDPAGTLVAEGWHNGAGTPHAEAAALEAAGARAAGCTAYVTLEPCHHTGRTLPCSRALAASGVARVVYAVADPNVSAGGGGAWLAEQGITVESGLLEDDGETLNRSWLHLMRTGRPWVTWKLASTLDGRSAAADGSSRWITGPLARQDVHEHRARCGAILVGTGTALIDDPSLTARRSDGTLHDSQPLRVVMGQRDLLTDARILDESAETIHLRTRSPREVLAHLADRQIHHVWLEGGPTVAAAFMADGFVDEIVAYIAPVLLGRGRPSVSDLGITTIDDALRLEPTDIRVLGHDIRITATLKESS